MNRVAAAALAYWAGGLALGFMLGSVRVLWVAPRLGEMGAVAAELPLMLGAGWWWARIVLRHAHLPDLRSAQRMGALAFAVLLVSECVLAALLFGTAPPQWARGLITPAGLLGLAGQAIWAVLPAWLWRDSRAG